MTENDHSLLETTFADVQRARARADHGNVPWLRHEFWSFQLPGCPFPTSIVIFQLWVWLAIHQNRWIWFFRSHENPKNSSIIMIIVSRLAKANSFVLFNPLWLGGNVSKGLFYSAGRQANQNASCPKSRDWQIIWLIFYGIFRTWWIQWIFEEIPKLV